MSIQLKSKFLQDYFCGEDVPVDIFVSSYRAALKVLNNPESFPKANYSYYAQLEQELILESPSHCGYCR